MDWTWLGIEREVSDWNVEAQEVNMRFPDQQIRGRQKIAKQSNSRRSKFGVGSGIENGCQRATAGRPQNLRGTDDPIEHCKVR